MPNDRCPVCDQPWLANNATDVAMNIAHLVQDHAWLLDHALAWSRNPESRLSHEDVTAEVARLRQHVRTMNKRIKWLVSQDQGGKDGKGKWRS